MGTHRRHKMQEVKLNGLVLVITQIHKYCFSCILFHLNQLHLEVPDDAMLFGNLRQLCRVLGDREHCLADFIEVAFKLELFVVPFLGPQIQDLLRSSTTFDWLLGFCENSCASGETSPILSGFFSCIISVDRHNRGIRVVKSFLCALDFIPVQFDSRCNYQLVIGIFLSTLGYNQIFIWFNFLDFFLRPIDILFEEFIVVGHHFFPVHKIASHHGKARLIIVELIRLEYSNSFGIVEFSQMGRYIEPGRASPNYANFGVGGEVSKSQCPHQMAECIFYDRRCVSSVYRRRFNQGYSGFGNDRLEDTIANIAVVTLVAPIPSQSQLHPSRVSLQ